MSLFRKSKTPPPPLYDPAVEEPVIRSSICTGERTAGFRNLSTGRFREYELIRDEDELQAFCKRCGVASCKTIY